MELKKLLMSSGKEDACGQLGSPKVEGTGKKGVAGQPQVRGRKLLPQCPGAGASPPWLPSVAVSSLPPAAASSTTRRF